MKILIVEDEKEINQLLCRSFEKDGFVVDFSYDGENALDKILGNIYDVVILDINIPHIDGIEVCKTARDNDIKMPIIMLTAKDKINDRINGLDSGADDYLIKPFDIRELKSRVNAMLRRQYNTDVKNITIGKITIDYQNKRSYYNGVLLDLTKKELEILHYLGLSYPKYCSIEDILEHCFDEYTDPFTNTVRVHLSSLRRKLKTACKTDLIENKKGDGYCMSI